MANLTPPESNTDLSTRRHRTKLPHRPKAHRTKRLRRWLLVGLAGVLALTAVTGAAAGLYIGAIDQAFTTNIQRADLMPDRPADQVVPLAGSRGSSRAVDYVFIGSNSRDPANPGASRGNTVMVLHLNANRKDAYLISFPSDLYVSIPGHGKNTISTAFSIGGAKLAVATLESLLHTRMDHVVLIDFDGFVGLTDDLGGVTVYNQYTSESEGYSFPYGTITVSGAQALAFVRERDLANGDIGRTQRQLRVLKAILYKGLSAKTIRSPSKFTRFVAGVAKHTVVDNQLTNKEIRRTALSLRMTGKDVHLVKAPIKGVAIRNGVSVDVVDSKKMAKLAKALRTDSMRKYAGV